MEKTIILVGIYNQQFQGTIFLMVFDLQGIYTETDMDSFRTGMMTCDFTESGLMFSDGGKSYPTFGARHGLDKLKEATDKGL